MLELSVDHWDTVMEVSSTNNALIIVFFYIQLLNQFLDHILGSQT